MTLTFNPKICSELLSKHLPRVIKSEEENEKVLAIVEELISRTELTPEEDTLLELLVALVEDFEDKHYQLNTSTPHSRLPKLYCTWAKLRHFTEQQDSRLLKEVGNLRNNGAIQRQIHRTVA